MYGRPNILFPLALLALLALLTFWIQHTVQPPAPKMDGSTRHDPDYILNNFITTRTDIQGNLRYKLIASEMRHYPDDDSTELQHPHITRYAPGQPSTLIEGQRGFVSSNGEDIQFLDNVKVVREAFKDRGEMVVLTEFLEVTPKKDLVTTDKPLVITQAPKTIIHATGMVYDKKQQTVKLLSNVKVHYERPGKVSEALGIEPKSTKMTGQDSKKATPAVTKTLQANKKGKASTSSPAKKETRSSRNKNAKKKPTSKQNTTRVRRQYEPATFPQTKP